MRVTTANIFSWVLALFLLFVPFMTHAEEYVCEAQGVPDNTLDQTREAIDEAVATIGADFTQGTSSLLETHISSVADSADLIVRFVNFISLVNAGLLETKLPRIIDVSGATNNDQVCNKIIQQVAPQDIRKDFQPLVIGENVWKMSIEVITTPKDPMNPNNLQQPSIAVVALAGRNLMNFSSERLYVMWLVFLQIANAIYFMVLLVIGILVSIRWDFQKYSLKALLPRFIIGGVLSQFSWLVCDLVMSSIQLLAEVLIVLGNAVGTGIVPTDYASFLATVTLCLSQVFASSKLGVVGTVIGGAAGGVNVVSVIADMLNQAVQGNIGGAVSELVVDGGTTAAATGICIAFAEEIKILFLMGIMLFILFLFTFFTIIYVRMLVIYGLVIISPILGVLYILPVTQKWVQKASDIFISLLMVYPTIALVALIVNTLT